MGFGSLYEDILDRYFDDAPSYDLPAPTLRRTPDEERLEAAIVELANRYRSKRLTAATDTPEGTTLGCVEAIHAVLSVTESPDFRADPTTMEEIAVRLRALLAKIPEHPLLTDADIRKVVRRSSDAAVRLEQLQADITRTQSSLTGKGYQALREIESRLAADINQAVRRYSTLAQSVERLWRHYQDRYRAAFSRRGNRALLKHLDGWCLDEPQRRWVDHEHDGCWRIQGPSGSGKTAILVHRALRLAATTPARVLLLTSTRGLADRLRPDLQELAGRRALPNLTVSSLYDQWRSILDAFPEERNRYRLRDESRSGELRERVSFTEPDREKNLWLVFAHDYQSSPFLTGRVQDLLNYLRARKVRDPERYVYEEVAYVRTAFMDEELPKYLELERAGRNVPLTPAQREVCLDVLRAWDEWLRTAQISDSVGVAWAASRVVLRDENLATIRERFGAEHILADEVQDLSTLDLRLIRRLGNAATSARNAYFFVGDVQQRGFVLHQDGRAAGFDFTGRSRNIHANYRNTQEILRAAYRVVSADDDIRADLERMSDVEIHDPELSPFHGPRPVVIQAAIRLQDHATLLRHLVEVRRSVGERSLLIVSPSSQLLESLRGELSRQRIGVSDVLVNEDLDRYRDVVAGDVVLAEPDAVRGLEFDTVIFADLSAGVMPRPGTPETWREAARCYSALTRAREELLITYAGQRSQFLAGMTDAVEELGDVPDRAKIERLMTRLIVRRPEGV